MLHVLLLYSLLAKLLKPVHAGGPAYVRNHTRTHAVIGGHKTLAKWETIANDVHFSKIMPCISTGLLLDLRLAVV